MSWLTADYTMIFLETQRLLFRTHQAKDKAEFVRMHGDPEVRRFVGGQAWSREKAESRFQNQYLGQPSKTYGLWATILKAEDKYIGNCGLRASENPAEANLGYYLARPYWGRGLASEACEAFIAVAFTRLKLSRLLADVDSGHTVSKHILKKFGFSFVSQKETTQSGRVIATYELLRPKDR
jgi:[ribosomal protein S5]-alanine N-acetyltransferase